MPMALSEFGECFDLVSKEIMPHEIYTEENLLKEYVPMSIDHEYYMSEKQEKEIELAIAQLINDIDRWDCGKMMSFIL